YKYDKDAIISAIREGITYALSEDAFTNNNTLIGAYRQTDTAYTLLTENATTKKPDDSHSYITLNENGVTRYLDLTALTETDDNSGGNSTSDTSAGTFTNVRTSYQAIVDYYNTSSYGYGDDLTTTLQKYADRMYDHVWSPDTTYAGTYGYGIPSKASPNQNSGYLSPFTDVPLNAWYVAAVRYANASGLMKGVSDTEFSPETNLTRAQVVQILYNLEKKPSVDGAAENFADVDDGDWYSDAVKWAVSNDVVKGLSDTEFGPDVQSNRETTATLLFRYAGHKEFDVSTEGADLSKYTDAGQIHDWAAEGMQWANVNGIINGVSATELSPLTLATRAQMAQIMKGFTSNSKFKSK
ncbi:MAG: S-layer homology domain-containing protein, partial [Firmicutes bacterium]|nr:S-layer homology domain-containing protein [Bacillota bacterium]